MTETLQNWNAEDVTLSYVSLSTIRQATIHIRIAEIAHSKCQCRLSVLGYTQFTVQAPPAYPILPTVHSVLCYSPPSHGSATQLRGEEAKKRRESCVCVRRRLADLHRAESPRRRA